MTEPGEPESREPGERVTGGHRGGLSTISIVVCTHNRPDRLRVCLDALQREVEDCDGAEVIVVDSASSTPTGELVVDRRRRWPSLRYERLTVTGLSVARNRGIELASGDVVAFVDDDAEPCEGWLSGLLNAYADPDVAAVGGPASLVWEGPEPAWLHPQQRSSYSALDLGPRGRYFVGREYPFGVNMSVRRSWAEAVGGFEPALGRRGDGLISNEEMVFFGRLGQLGGRAWYEPRAAVRHHVGRERASVWWLLRRSWAQGRSDIIARRTVIPDSRELGLGGHRPKGVLLRFRRFGRGMLRKDVDGGVSVRAFLVNELAAFAEFGGALHEWGRGRFTSRHGRWTGDSVPPPGDRP
jgi:glycosyltransferase involved in cell wall biosynthesis